MGGIGKNANSPGRPTKISPPSKTTAVAKAPAETAAGGPVMWRVCAGAGVVSRARLRTRLRLDTVRWQWVRIDLLLEG